MLRNRIIYDLNAYSSFVIGAQSFNITAEGIYLGLSEVDGLCNPSALANVTRGLIRGRIAFVYADTVFNTSCMIAQQASFLQSAGALAAVFVTAPGTQLGATTWSDTVGKNTSSIPVLFSSSYIMSDILIYNSTEAALFIYEITGGALFLWRLYSDGSTTTSNWIDISRTYGYIFQVVFTILFAFNLFLALRSLFTIVKADWSKKKPSITTAAFCLMVEMVANAVRVVYFIVDPLFMWGTFPVEVHLFLNLGLVSLTLMSIVTSATFWTRVVFGKASSKPVTMADIWIVVVIFAIVMVMLEFLDGILYCVGLFSDTLVDINSNMGFNTAFAIVCFLVASFMLFAGTFLLRRVRVGLRLKSEAKSRLQRSIVFFVLTEQVSLLVLTIWFLMVAWLDLLDLNNISYWVMETVYFLALWFLSVSCIAVYYRSPRELTKASSETTDKHSEKVEMLPQDNNNSNKHSGSPVPLHDIGAQFESSGTSLNSL